MDYSCAIIFSESYGEKQTIKKQKNKQQKQNKQTTTTTTQTYKKITTVLVPHLVF